MAIANLDMWSSPRSHIWVTYDNTSGAIQTLNATINPGVTVGVTVHQLNPPKPDITISRSGPATINQNVPNGYNLVNGGPKLGWYWPGDVISFEISETV